MVTAQTARETPPTRHELPACRFERRVIEERLAERTRVAQELHDTLLQELFAVSLELQAATSQLPADSAAKPRFHSLVQLMDRLLEEGRRMVQGLRSPDRQLSSLSRSSPLQ